MNHVVVTWEGVKMGLCLRSGWCVLNKLSGCINLSFVHLQGDDASAAVGGSSGAKSESRGNGPLSGGGLMEEMSALLARR